MLLQFQYCMSKPPTNKHNNQQCNIKAISNLEKKRFQSMLNLE